MAVGDLFLWLLFEVVDCGGCYLLYILWFCMHITLVCWVWVCGFGVVTIGVLYLNVFVLGFWFVILWCFGLVF